VRVPDVDAALRAARDAGINPGLPLRGLYPELGDALLVAITERRTRADIDRLAGVLAGVREEVPA
jgi:glycine dehydrogenase subunit 1